jgi:DNA-binding MarR family transcriptional regulator
MKQVATQHRRALPVDVHYADLPLDSLLQIAGRMVTTQLEAIGGYTQIPAPALSLLAMVVRFPGLPLTRYATILSINNATLNRYVDRMESEELLERIRGHADRRLVTLAVTPQGQELAADLEMKLAGMASDFKRHLDVSEERQMTAVLRKLLSGWASDRT